jgi:predicted ArsR family transcriptional regulator
MKSSSREKILGHLEAQKSATAAQLSRALQVTPADIRYHLGLLVEAGKIEIGGKITTHERGRPSQIYRLAPRARQDNLTGLVRALLETIQKQSSYIELQDIARRLSDSAGRQVPRAGPRLLQAVKHLNALHYQARWEAHANAPQMLLGNCPYAEIIADHPELCQLDATLLEQLTGFKAQQTEKLQPNQEGAIYCRFLLQPQPAPD